MKWRGSLTTTRVENRTRGTTLHEHPELATTVVARVRGFMFTRPGKRAKLFLFTRPRKELIHMWFVFGPIDLVALDRKGVVVGLRQGLRPWHVWRSPTMSVLLELPAGTIRKSGTEIGDRIVLPDVTIPG